MEKDRLVNAMSQWSLILFYVLAIVIAISGYIDLWNVTENIDSVSTIALMKVLWLFSFIWVLVPLVVVALLTRYITFKIFIIYILIRPIRTRIISVWIRKFTLNCFYMFINRGYAFSYPSAGKK